MFPPRIPLTLVVLAEPCRQEHFSPPVCSNSPILSLFIIKVIVVAITAGISRRIRFCIDRERCTDRNRVSNETPSYCRLELSELVMRMRDGYCNNTLIRSPGRFTPVRTLESSPGRNFIGIDVLILLRIFGR